MSGRFGTFKLMTAILCASLALLGCNEEGSKSEVALPALSIADASAKISDNKIDFIVTLSSPSASQVTVQFDTSDVTTVAEENYHSVHSQALIFPSGSIQATASVFIINNSVRAADKILKVTLHDAVGSSIAKDSAFGAIENNNVGPAAFFTQGSQDISQLSGTAFVAVALTTPATSDATIGYHLSGSAQPDSDYIGSDGQIRIQKGTTAGAIFLPIVANAAARPDRTIVVQLQSPVNAVLLEPIKHTITIKYDGKTPLIQATGVPQGYSNTVALNITVTGSTVSSYKYKLGSGANCADEAGYSAEALKATPITDDISLLSDGSLSICLLGKDANNIWMSPGSASKYTWFKDTTTPPSPFSLALVSPLSNYSKVTTPTIRASGLIFGNQLNLYSDSSCSNLIASGLVTSSKMDLNIAVGLSPGAYRIYANQSNLIPNFSNCSNDYVVYTVDLTLPVITSVSMVSPGAVFGKDQPVLFALSYSKPVLVTGSPIVTMNINDRKATYVSGSGTNILIFKYVPQTGDTTSALDLINASALDLNGGKITDLQGNGALLDTPQPGGAGSLAAGRLVQVDTTAPDAPQSVDNYPWTNSLGTSPTITWSVVSDPSGSGFGHYEVAVGRTPGAIDVLPWTNVNQTQSFTVGGLGLANGGTYYPSIRAVDLAGNASVGQSSSGWTVDKYPPVLTSINDGSAYPDGTRTPLFIWSAAMDQGSGIKGYLVAVGSSPGLADIVPFIYVGDVTSKYFEGLSLTLGNKYYASVRGIDNAGNFGNILSGDGWTVGCQLGTIYVDSSQDCQPVWPIGKDGDLTISSGQVVEIEPGSVHDYRNVTINSGGVLRIRRLSVSDPWAQIGISGNLALNGKIEGIQGGSAGVFTGLATANNGTKSGEQLTLTLSQSRGGEGGSATTAATGWFLGQTSFPVIEYTASASSYSNLLKQYGIWGSSESDPSFVQSRTLNFPVDGYYTFLGACDNEGWFYLDGSQILYSPGFTSNSTAAIYVSAGFHSISQNGANYGGPGRIVLQILKPDGSELFNSRMQDSGIDGRNSLGLGGHESSGNGGGGSASGSSFSCQIPGRETDDMRARDCNWDWQDLYQSTYTDVCDGYGCSRVYDYAHVGYHEGRDSAWMTQVYGSGRVSCDATYRGSPDGCSYYDNTCTKYYSNTCVTTATNGANATPSSPGGITTASGSTGGAGGVRGDHGEAIYIKVVGSVSGTGLIDVHGSNGANGASGTNGGGLGGGGAGGTGGAIVIRYVSNWPASIQLNALGGSPGSGGAGAQAGATGVISIQPTSYP
jgi:hypothetical protein